MSKEEYKTISFNENWFYSSRCRTDLSTIVQSIDDDDEKSLWKSIQLPHLLNIDETSSPYRQRHHWYYKKFQWDKLSKESDERVELIFNSAVDNITIWFNSVEVFSQLTPIDSVAIDLTEYLSYSNDYEQFNDDNILFIRSRYHSLSTTVQLIVKQSKKDLTNSDFINSSSQLRSVAFPIRKYRVLDYLVVYNQSDGQFNIHSNYKMESIEKSSLSHLPRITIDHVDNRIPQSSSNERIRFNEIQVPRLNIVMLIVGTRGDVQPFLA